VKPLDKLLQKWRSLKAGPNIPEGSRVLDVGCADGVLYHRYSSRISEYVGIDPILKSSVQRDNYMLIAGKYPEDLPEQPPFDVITMLAVVEHLSEELQERTATAILQHLASKGKLIITTPSPAVDNLLVIMKKLRMIDGMSLEEHYAFDFREVPRLFEDLELILHQRFQFGLNHLFVFQKS
jgi:2-polyprenyl-3-methyl-5-hydroxy-6-metoxy-1,4-benzoquinol methylase